MAAWPNRAGTWTSRQRRPSGPPRQDAVTARHGRRDSAGPSRPSPPTLPAAASRGTTRSSNCGSTRCQLLPGIRMQLCAVGCGRVAGGAAGGLTRGRLGGVLELGARESRRDGSGIGGRRPVRLGWRGSRFFGRCGWPESLDIARERLGAFRGLSRRPQVEPARLPGWVPSNAPNPYASAMAVGNPSRKDRIPPLALPVATPSLAEASTGDHGASAKLASPAVESPRTAYHVLLPRMTTSANARGYHPHVRAQS